MEECMSGWIDGRFEGKSRQRGYQGNVPKKGGHDGVQSIEGMLALNRQE